MMRQTSYQNMTRTSFWEDFYKTTALNLLDTGNIFRANKAIEEVINPNPRGETMANQRLQAPQYIKQQMLNDSRVRRPEWWEWCATHLLPLVQDHADDRALLARIVCAMTPKEIYALYPGEHLHPRPVFTTPAANERWQSIDNLPYVPTFYQLRKPKEAIVEKEQTDKKRRLENALNCIS
eukprot:29785-Eustigmatos_ZCMA.PRE.1